MVALFFDNLQDLVSPFSEILTNAIRNTIYPVDFSTYSTCPRPMERDEPEVPLNYPIHYDSLAVRSHGQFVVDSPPVLSM